LVAGEAGSNTIRVYSDEDGWSTSDSNFERRRTKNPKPSAYSQSDGHDPEVEIRMTENGKLGFGSGAKLSF